MFVPQKTLISAIGATGVGLHSGHKSSITLRPAGPGTGLVLDRTDIGTGDGVIPLSWDRVVDSRFATTVANERGVSVSTVEHLMAAFAGCEIDNAVVEIDGPEMPIMDGSAAPFVRLIECAGIGEQDAPRQAIRVLKPMRVTAEGKSIDLLPADEFGIDFEIDFDSDAIARQELSVLPTNGTFRAEIANARTFGFEHEVTALRAAGYALGGSLANAVVVSGDRVLNAEGLRYDDEFVRHKILDCMGDLYLAGAPLIATVKARCSGHALNHALLCALFDDPDAWRYEALLDVAADAPAVFDEELRVANG